MRSETGPAVWEAKERSFGRRLNADALALVDPEGWLARRATATVISACKDYGGSLAAGLLWLMGIGTAAGPQS